MSLALKSATTSFKSFILSGLCAGVTWGISALLISKISGAFLFEKTFLQNFFAFIFGGLTFGVAFTGILSLSYNIIPTNHPVTKSTITSFAIWCLLKVGGLLLQLTDDKYAHTTIAQNLQGLLLVLSLGILSGIYLSIFTKPKIISLNRIKEIDY